MKNLLLLLVAVAAAPLFAAQSDKHALAKAILTEFGVAERFDVYLARSADQVAGGGVQNPKMQSWLHGLWIQELGWKTVEDAYISHFEARFSETELRELVALSKNPVVRKLLKEEVEAFRATAATRSRTFEVFWRRYNSMEFSPPAEALK